MTRQDLPHAPAATDTALNAGAALNAEAALSAIVEATPRAAAILESFGLDYCCNGADRLGDACAVAGLDPAAVIDEVMAAAASQPDAHNEWADMDPAQLVLHIESLHHSYLHSELPRLDALADKVAGVHGDRHPELHEVRRVFRELRADLEPHLLKEERVLFPMVRELVASEGQAEFHCGSLQNPISVMLLEHDRAGELLVELRSATNGYSTPSDGCASYHALYDGLAEVERDTHLHIHKENNVLFPAVVELEAQGS